MSDARIIFKFLAQNRFRLNLIFMAAKFLTWFTWIGTVSGVIFLTVQWIGWFPFRIGIWILISSIGGLAGLILGWWRRLDNRATASWLDEQLNSGELLSAALVCLERGCSGCFDQQIIDSANAFSDKPSQIQWPVRYLLKQAGLVAAAILLFTVGLLYWSPVFHRNAVYTLLKAAGVDQSTAKLSRSDSQRLVVESPRTLAKLLFPEDVRMAMLAEKAFREGNLPVLQNLLRDAEFNMERLIAEAANPEEQRRLKNEVEQRQQLMESLLAESERENQTGSASQEGESSTSSQLANGKGKGEQKKDNRLAQRGGSQKEQSLQNGPNSDDYKPYGSIPSGGTKAGTGHNSNQGNWGKIAGHTGKEETIISKNKDSQILEYILPGKNARLPLTQVIPDAERSAEAAMYREGIPYEYEEFVRNYFLLLSKETKDVATKEAQK